MPHAFTRSASWAATNSRIWNPSPASVRTLSEGLMPYSAHLVRILFAISLRIAAGYWNAFSSKYEQASFTPRSSNIGYFFSEGHP